MDVGKTEANLDQPADSVDERRRSSTSSGHFVKNSYSRRAKHSTIGLRYGRLARLRREKWKARGNEWFGALSSV
jgi:hypothetical protein